MSNSYADVLESYVIAEEGFFDFFTFKKNKKPSPARDEKGVYSAKVQDISDMIQNEYPDLVKKEFDARRKCLNDIKKAIVRIGKKYKFPGFDVYLKDIDKALQEPEDFPFLSEILPIVTPDNIKDANNNSDLYFKYIYAFENDWEVSVYGGNQSDWFDSLPEDKKPTTRFIPHEDDLWSQFRDKIFEIILNELKSNPFVYGLYDGGDNDGSAIDVIFKPSDQILKIAKEKGYLWFK